MSSLGIRDIVSLLSKFGSKDQNIAAAENRKDIGLFQGYVPSFWTAAASGISPNKGAELGDKDVNFEVPLSGKTTKVPEEHTCVDSLCYQPGALKLITTCSETEAPSEAGTTQENSSDSGQKGSQASPDTGKPAAQVSKSPTGSDRYCRSSSSGSGGDDGDDGLRRIVPPGGCQRDNQYSVDDSDQREQQPEEQSHQGGDCPNSQDSMSAPTKVPSDTGNSKDKTTTSNQKKGQTPKDDRKPAGQVSKTQQGNTSYRRSSSGSGGDDGGEDRRRTLRTGGCQGDGHCEVDDLGETEPSEQDDHQVQEQSPPQNTENILVGVPSCDSPKKSAAQGLKIDVTGARKITEASFELQKQSNDLQSEPVGGLSLSDQCHPETDLREAEQRLQKAFSCRRSLNSENEWQKCGETCCREIQEYLGHSQNCHMRVLGGCKKCICFKESLLYHASRCHLPVGACVVQKCDTIREYMKENRIPDNRKWPYQLDKLFFRPSPPATPTSSPEKGNHIDQHFMAQLQEAFSSRPEAHDINDTDNLDHPSLISDGSLRSSIEESLRESSGVWNQYHVDRPPDLLPPAVQQSDLHVTGERSPDAQVTRGPTVNAQVRLPPISDGQVESSAPLSVACMPDIKQTEKPISQEEKGEVIWPLDQRVLSVGEDGSYIEGVHWRQVKYIGGGSCGRCYFCVDAKTGRLFAIKRIPVRQYQQMEIDTWGSISGQHPNILELYGAVKHKDAVVIFMEYMEGGSVEEYGKLDEGRAVHILGKVISAVEFMHSRRLLHRDIKGGNVLVDATGQKVKLADFGTTITCDGYLQDNYPRGTEAFMAPEVCRSEQHSFSADIWGLMCLFYQMLVGKPPWMEFSYGSLLFKIGTASQPPQSPPCSPEVEDFFSQGFVLEPSERATAAELLRHPVFVTGPYVSNIPLPAREEIWLGEDGNLSSEISDSDTDSLVSEQSSDSLTTDCEAGDCIDDQEEEMDNDDDDTDSEASDGCDDGNRNMLEPDCLRVEAAMFIEEPWQGLDLSAEEQLQSLQSELFFSLEGQDLERVLNEIEENADVNDNDINLLKGEDFDVGQFIGSLLGGANISSTQPPSGAFAIPEGSYSITDLTKLHIKDSEGNLLFTIRERPSTSYGHLGEEHHGNIASVLQLNAFTLTRDDGTALNVRAEIGFEEQAVRVVRAHDNDNWQPYRWRVDVYGRVEQFFEF